MQLLEKVTEYLFIESERAKQEGTGQFLLGSYSFGFIIIVILGFLLHRRPKVFLGDM